MQCGYEHYVVLCPVDLQIGHVQGLCNDHAVQGVSKELAKLPGVDHSSRQMGFTEILPGARNIVVMCQNRDLGAAWEHEDRGKQDHTDCKSLVRTFQHEPPFDFNGARQVLHHLAFRNTVKYFSSVVCLIGRHVPTINVS